MNIQASKLGIPLVDPVRVPIKTILENLNEPTARQKSLIQKHVASVHLISILDQKTIHRREYRDSTYWYSAIYIMEVLLKTTTDLSDVMGLLHQAFPEATVFLAVGDGKSYITAATKRVNQIDDSRSVVEDVAISLIKDDAEQYMDIGNLPGDNLKEYFDNVVKHVYKLKVFNTTGVYPEADADYKTVMKKHDALQQELNALREEYKQATMQAEKIDIDDKIYDKENEVANLIRTLKGNK